MDIPGHSSNCQLNRKGIRAIIQVRGDRDRPGRIQSPSRRLFRVIKLIYLLVSCRGNDNAFGGTPKAADEDVRAPPFT
jgi:hypothetical protein